MRLLLDTSAVVWLTEADPRLSGRVLEAMDQADERLASAVTGYEIALKVTIGKLARPVDLERWLDSFGVRHLPVTWQHADAAGRLPLHHRDPWDRILVAQAQLEDLTIVTSDPAIERYDVGVLRADQP